MNGLKWFKSNWVVILLVVLAAVTVMGATAGYMYYQKLQEDIGGATLENLKD